MTLRAFACAVLALGAVAPAFADKAPPTIETALAELKKMPLCYAQPVSAAEMKQAEQDAGGPPFPPRLSTRCSPALPTKWYDHLIDAKVEASCGVLVDVDEKGVPKVPEAQCNIKSRSGGFSNEWRIYYEAIFGMASMRAAVGSRWLPKTSGYQDTREDVFVTYQFALGANQTLEKITRFKRSMERK
jgi:hypothetical protein